MATQTQKAETNRAQPAGTHLRCESCGSEVEIIRPCGCNPPDQILQCCGRDMKPTSATS